RVKGLRTYLYLIQLCVDTGDAPGLTREGAQFRNAGLTGIRCEGASRREGASGRQRIQRRHPPGDLVKPLALHALVGDRGEQALRIGMLRRLEDGIDIRLLDLL